MFENLRKAFSEAVDNFKTELNRDQVPEAVDRLLRGMRDEVTDAKTRLHDIESARDRALAEARKEKKEVETCIRRAEMAREIGDEETARVAAEYGEKHRRRMEVLKKKASALDEELEVRKAEIEEMLDKIREARKQREALGATAGRADARESIRGAKDLFDELDRMAEKIEDDDRRREAAEDLFDEVELGGEDYEPEPSTPSRDVDERLAELKRRMGEE